MTTVTAVITTHPARFNVVPYSTGGGGTGKLDRALQSVMRQNRQPDAIVVANDLGRGGAAVNRQRALNMVTTEWMAWLDSDDEWYPEHLQVLLEAAEQTGASFLFTGYDTEGHDPLGHFGIPFDPAHPYHTTITFMVKTALAQEVGFRPDASVRQEGVEFTCGNEDWLHIVELCQLIAGRGLGAVHVAEKTWYYHIDGGNSSGVAGQGDAA